MNFTIQENHDFFMGFLRNYIMTPNAPNWSIVPPSEIIDVLLSPELRDYFQSQGRPLCTDVEYLTNLYCCLNVLAESLTVNTVSVITVPAYAPYGKVIVLIRQKNPLIEYAIKVMPDYVGMLKWVPSLSNYPVLRRAKCSVDSIQKRVQSLVNA